MTTKQEKIKAYRPFTYKALGPRNSRSNYKSSKSKSNYNSSNSSKQTYTTDSQPSFFEWFFHPWRAKAKAKSIQRLNRSSHASSENSAKASTVSPSKGLLRKSSRRESTASSSTTSPQELSSPPSKQKSDRKSELKPKPKSKLKSELKAEKRSGKSSDRTEKHGDHSDDEQPPYLWMLASGGYNRKPRNRRSKRLEPSNKSASEVGTEKGTTSGQKSTSSSHAKKEKKSHQVSTSLSPPTEKRTDRKPIKASPSKPKLRPSHPFRRTKEEPWDVFDLLAPWMLTNKQKREYDQAVKACNDERVRQGKLKK